MLGAELIFRIEHYGEMINREDKGAATIKTWLYEGKKYYITWFAGVRYDSWEAGV